LFNFRDVLVRWLFEFEIRFEQGLGVGKIGHSGKVVFEIERSISSGRSTKLKVSQFETQLTLQNMNISGLDKVKLLKGLWENTKPAAYFAQYNQPAPSFDEKLAQEAVKKPIDYFCGRAIKLDLSGDAVEVWTNPDAIMSAKEVIETFHRYSGEIKGFGDCDIGDLSLTGNSCMTSINGVTYRGKRSVVIKNGRVIIDGCEVGPSSKHIKPLPPAPVLAFDADATTLIAHLDKFVGLHDRAKVLVDHDNAFSDAKLAPSALKAIELCGLHDRAPLVIQWLDYCPTFIKALRGWTADQFAALLELCAFHSRTEVFNKIVDAGIELEEDHVGLLSVHDQTQALLKLLKLVKSKTK
jgi:hypothetical protein